MPSPDQTIDRNLQNSPPDIVLGVLNYNRSDDAIDTIEALLETDYPEDRFTVVLLDNASTDNSIARVRDRFGSRVEIVREPQNRGPVARNRLMLDRPESYVFMFDEDCRPEDRTTIRSIVDFMERSPRYGALCFACFNPHLGILEYGHPGESYSHLTEDGTYEGMYVIGNGMCYRTAMIAKTEGFDERLLWGGEEYDLALELLYHDIPIAFRPEFRLIHYHTPRAHSSRRSMELDMRNNIWIVTRRFPLGLLLPVLSAHIGRRLLFSFLKRDWNRFQGYLRGIRSAIPRLSEFWASRKPVPYRRFVRERIWLLQMLYAPRVFSRAHKAAVNKRTGNSEHLHATGN